jgi:hypothetical protein
MAVCAVGEWSGSSRATTLDEAKEAREFPRRSGIKLDEICGSMPTSSEIAKLRNKVADNTESAPPATPRPLHRISCARRKGIDK